MLQTILRTLFKRCSASDTTKNKIQALQYMEFLIQVDFDQQDIDVAFQRVMTELVNMFDCNHVWLINANNTTLPIETVSSKRTVIKADNTNAPGVFEQLYVLTVMATKEPVIMSGDNVPRQLSKTFRVRHIMSQSTTSSNPWVISVTRKKPWQPEEVEIFKRIVKAMEHRFDDYDIITKYKKLAYHDGLTGLPNRTLFYKNIDRLLSDAESSQHKVAVLLIDLDNFKRINDTYGHASGDEYLIEIAKRLDISLLNNKINHIETPSSDVGEPIDYTTARLGGDEFAIAFQFSGSNMDLVLTAIRSIHDNISQDMIIGGNVLTPSASIGVSLFPYDGSDKKKLLKTADLALYLSKHQGKNQFQFHHAKLSIQAEEDLRLEKTIEYFIDSNDFELMFQPLVDSRAEHIVGAEALFRGNPETHPHTDITKLIAVAETSGLIVPLGLKIIEKACVECLKCLSNGCPNMSVAVNVSPRQLMEDGFDDQVISLLESISFPPSHLTMEITESLFVHNLDDSVEKLKKLSSHGIHIAIDDFGTGYSSLSYIKHLPVHKLKIDIRFVENMDTSIKDAEIVKAVISMAKTLGFITIAEGVEKQTQLDMLRDYGCDQIQGFFYGGAVNPEAFVEFVEKHSLSVDS